MQKINVLFCIPYLAHGGTEKQLLALLAGVDRERITPHLCCINKQSVESLFMEDAIALFEQTECKKIQLDFKSFKNPSVIVHVLKFAQYLYQNKIDIIVSYFIDPPILSFLASKCSFRQPVHVVSFRDLGLLRDSHHFLLRYVFRKTNHFLANSEAVKQDYIKNDAIPIDKIKVIYNGLDIDSLVKIKRDNGAPRTVGIIANLNRRVKRVDIFIKAAAIVCEKVHNVSFVVVGEGALKSELEALAISLGVGGRVDFVGRSYDIIESLKKIDVGVNTSETEGFTNAILEFLAAGVPVVATNSGGNSEIIDDGVNGYLFNVNDYRSLSEKLISLLTDKDKYRLLSSQCRKKVAENFDVSSMLRSYEQYIIDVAREGKNASF